MRSSRTALGLIAIVAVSGPVILAGPSPDPAAEFHTAELAYLDLLVGSWKIEQKHFDPAGAIITTAEGTEDITWVLDKHAIQRIYRTRDASSTFEAIGLLTWSAPAQRFEGIWLDNASASGPARASAEWNPKDRAFLFELEAPAAEGIAKYKTIDRFESDSVRLAVTYRIKGGEVVKVSEVKYTRTTPCPAKIRILFEDS